MTKLTANNVKFTRSVGTTTVQAVPPLPTYTTATLLTSKSPPITQNSMEFGSTVAIHGNLMLVGSHRYNNYRGIAFLFDVSTGNLLHTFYNPNNVDNDNFSRYSLGLSDSYSVIGAYGVDTGGSGTGAVYVFDNSTGNLLHTFNGTNSGENFGWSVSISGNRIAVGSPAFSSYNGKVTIFEADSGNLITTFTNYRTGQENFGREVEIDGDYLIVGSYRADDFGVADSGKADIYHISTIATFVTTISNPNEYSTAKDDYFGSAVAIKGNYAMVAAPSEDSAAGFTSGAVYVYKTETGNWSDITLLHTIVNPNINTSATADGFSEWNAIGISGKYAVIGAHLEDTPAGNSGVVYLYDLTDASLVTTIMNPGTANTANNDNFGYSVSIDNDYIAIGARYEDGTISNEGKAYIYQLS